MKTDQLDIVIPLKENGGNEELRYTLRSIALNMPHRRVFLAGYMPDWVQNVEHIPVEAPLGLKYAKSSANTKAACLDPRVTDDFILFNDDFFVMKRLEKLHPMHRGDIDDFIDLYEKLDTTYVNYRAGIYRVRTILRKLGVDGVINSYELHVPMIFNKNKRLQAYDIQDRYPCGDLALHTNTLYGNLFGVGGTQVKDVKYDDPYKQADPDAAFLSCGDLSFVTGHVGRYIRSKFQSKCKYEKGFTDIA